MARTIATRGKHSGTLFSQNCITVAISFLYGLWSWSGRTFFADSMASGLSCMIFLGLGSSIAAPPIPAPTSTIVADLVPADGR